jgi:hypothetical protein
LAGEGIAFFFRGDIFRVMILGNGRVSRHFLISFIRNVPSHAIKLAKPYHSTI